tara:strand:+ start:1580 stop:1996 length:417 start_codon:yes stop_codon:yes gene_type:complete
MAKEKKKEGVMFPSLMSMLGIGGSTKGLLGDVTGTSGMGGVVGSLKDMGKKKEGKDSEIQRFSDPKVLKEQRERVRNSYNPFSSRNGLLISGFPRASGSGDMTEKEFAEGARQIMQIQNPLERELRKIRLLKQWNFGV